MIKRWLIKVLFGRSMLLETILIELQGIHYHLDRMEIFYKMVNRINEDDEKITMGDIIIRKNKTEGDD